MTYLKNKIKREVVIHNKRNELLNQEQKKQPPGNVELKQNKTKKGNVPETV